MMETLKMAAAAAQSTVLIVLSILCSMGISGGTLVSHLLASSRVSMPLHSLPSSDCW